MITDMDMLPMNRTYYTENIKSFDNSKFIYFRGNVCISHKEIAICYNVASPKTWKEMVVASRKLESAMGDGKKQILEQEVLIAEKLRAHLS